MTGDNRSSSQKNKTKTSNINLLYKRIKNSLKFGWNFALCFKVEQFDEKLLKYLSIQQMPALHPINITIITMVRMKIIPSQCRPCIKEAIKISSRSLNCHLLSRCRQTEKWTVKA